MSSDQPEAVTQSQSQSFSDQAFLLWTRFEQSGNREDLDMVIALQQFSLDSCPRDHSDCARTLHDLALFLYKRYERWGNAGDLERTISLNRDALDLRPEGHPDRYFSLGNLANTLRARYGSKGRLEDLEEAISLERAAVELAHVGYPHISLLLNNLVRSLWTRFEHSGRMEDLDEAIKLGQASLELRPEGQPHFPSTLVNLANCLRTRFGHRGWMDDLNRAISLERAVLVLLPEGHPNRPSALGNLASSLWTCFEHSGKTEELEEAISLERAALELRSQGHPERSLSLGNLANCLRTRFNLLGSMEDLEEAIVLNRASLELRAEGHPHRSSSLDNLAICLWARFEHSGRIEDIEQAILMNRHALELRPQGHALRSLSLGNLANCLRTYFICCARMEDLEEAITLEHAALELRPEGHPHRASSLGNLASSLWTRFEQGGRVQDLEEAIILSRASVELRPQEHPLHSLSLSNLANFLLTRFEHDGRTEDLQEAITLNRAALEHQPEGDPNRSLLLVNLANSVWKRFEHDRKKEDLEESISLKRAALELRPDSHPLHYLSLGNYAAALSTRFEHGGSIEDLEEAIKLERSVLKLHPKGHPHHPLFLDNLAVSLLRLFQYKGRVEDLEEAIVLQRAALELKPQGHPGRSVSLMFLSEFLHHRFQKDARVDDLEESIQFLQQSTAHTFSSFQRRLETVQRWMEVARSYDHHTLLEAHRTAMSLLQRGLTIRPTLSAQHKFISNNSLYQTLALNAASHAINKHDLTLAIELLEQGRALLWSQMRGLRTPLEQLSNINGSLAERLQGCNRRLEALMTSSESRMSGSGMNGFDAQSNNLSKEQHSIDEVLAQMRRLSDEQEELINEVRRINGFEDFLKAAPFITLQQVAAEGPVIVLNHSEFRCDALIITSGQETPCVCIPLDDDFYSDSIKRYEELIQGRKKFGLRSKKYDDILRRVMKMLWDRVVSKVVQKLKEFGVNEGSRIWWCPTSVLSALPFHAAGPYEGADGRVKYLLDDYISSYTPTLTSLINARSSIQSRQEKMLFVADTKLPSANEERDWIRRSRRPIDKQLLDDRATPETVLRLLPGAQWVHFTCHGLLDKEPFKSSLKLPGGKLTLLDIARADLPNAEFAFLSACHTAEQGPKFALDEALHLAAAMQFCGFRSVVGTMWKLLDRDGPFLVRTVYAYMMLDLEEGEIRFKRAAAGMRQAALKLRDRGDEEPNGRRVDIMAERWVNMVHIGA
ncbi:TPR-like protein [Sanghuangporus baumii]|uniref:TPR-like protein n=1 Tax=Sanghuangporus baumii TaxID=108892 RepID=A0A9Q5N8R0_SANBA|nr:TPR-like protein [Sanghuangporus baumii]